MCSIHVISSFVRHSCYYSDSACICVAQSDYFYDYLLRLSDEILHVWYKNWHLLNILAFKCTFGLKFLWDNLSSYSRSLHSSPLGRLLFDDSSSLVVYAIHRFYLTRIKHFIIRLIFVMSALKVHPSALSCIHVVRWQIISSHSHG